MPEISKEAKQEAFNFGVSLLCEAIRKWMERTGYVPNNTPVVENRVIFPHD